MYDYMNNSQYSSGGGGFTGTMTKQKAFGMSPKVKDFPGSKLSIDTQPRKLPYPQIDFKVDDEFPIKILDNMIQVEEEMNAGFSLYNRGQKLKKSLIDPDRVKQYLQKMEQEE